MHDLGYVVAGYALTVAAVGGYRWRLSVRSRHAREVVRVAARRGGGGR